jgi:hypothetical protein
VVVVCPRAYDTGPLASMSTASPQRHVLLGLPAFFYQPYAVYIRPGGLANFHTVFWVSITVSATVGTPRDGGVRARLCLRC